MIKSFKTLVLAASASAALIAAHPALAGNTTFLTDKNGQQVFPFSPPNRATGGPGLIDNTDIGNTVPKSGRFTRLISAGGTPTIASGACGATTNGTLAAGSTDQAGTVQIGAATTTVCTVSFSATLNPAPKTCVLFPANAAAAATGTTVAYVSGVSGSGFVITGAALASANYRYVCM